MAQASSAEALDGVHRKFEKAFNAGDLEGLVALYEATALLIPGPGLTARGKDEIRAALQQFLTGRPAIHIETVAAFESAGVGLTHGKWTLKGTDADGKPFESGGTSAEVLRRQADGRWLYVVDNPFGA